MTTKIDDQTKPGSAEIPSRNGDGLGASPVRGYSEAISEYFDWLTESEVAEDGVGNTQARDAIARASSQLGCLLIKHGIYSANGALSSEGRANE